MGNNKPAAVMDDFPVVIEEPVFYCGFNSPKSYGGNSYFVRHLFDNRFLFTGDHLDFDRHHQRLSASHDYCWHSWPQQIESMRRLLSLPFDWVRPGHGQRVHLAREEMHRQLKDLVERMRVGTE